MSDDVNLLLKRLMELGGMMPEKRVNVVNHRFAPCVECEFIIRRVWDLRGD